MNADEHKIEELDVDDAKLVQMLAGLKRVDAPANFEFKVKARIANAERPKASVGFLPSFVRYAAPLALVGAVSTLFFLNSSNTTDTAAVSTMGVAPQVSQVLKAESQAPVIAEESSSESIPARSALAANSLKHPVPARQAAVQPERRIFGEKKGSEVKASSPPTFITPQQPAPIPQTKVSMTQKEVFPMLGIDAGYEDGWKIKAVRVNSVADRAGLKAGDVLEAIDENQLGKEPVFKSGFNGKVMKVRREGKVVELNLDNK